MCLNVHFGAAFLPILKFLELIDGGSIQWVHLENTIVGQKEVPRMNGVSSI